MEASERGVTPPVSASEALTKEMVMAYGRNGGDGAAGHGDAATTRRRDGAMARWR